MKNILKKILITSIIISVLLTTTGICYILIAVKDVKVNTEKLGNNTVNIYDNSNNIISSYNNYVEYKNIPTNLINAFVSTEDKRFFEHNGIDIYRMLSALINDIKTLSFSEGASTITQQLVKNTHLSNEKTLDRKIKEIKLSLELENYYTKEDILEYYLNILYFGENIYGIGNASYKFFNKNVSELTLEECATIAGIVKSPRLYSPSFNYDNSLNRRNLILNNMYKQKYINESEYYNAKNKKLIVKDGYDIASSYKQAVIDEAKNILNIDENEILNGKYKIYTYYDNNKQSNLINSIKNNVVYNLSKKIADASSLILDNNTGGVQAYYNNTNYSYNSLIRQPGSILKPFVSYLPAISYGHICPDSIINDEQISFGDYAPHNFHNKYYGNITIREAVCNSSNSVAVKLMNDIGMYTSIDYAKKYGLKFNHQDYNLATALGGITDGVSLLDIGGAYMTIANNGYYIKPQFIRIIEDNYGNIIYKNANVYKRIEDSDTIYLMTSILHDVTKNGTAKMLSSLPYYLASKTGTVSSKTGNNKDIWNATFNSSNTYIIWYGNTTNNSNNDISSTITGGTKPTKIVYDLINNCKVYCGNYIQPNTIQEIYINENEYLTNNKIVLSTVYTNKKIICNKQFYNNLVANYQKSIRKADMLNLY